MKAEAEKIREAQPKRLYIAADGPRENHKGESEKCEVTRKSTLDMIKGVKNKI